MKTALTTTIYTVINNLFRIEQPWMNILKVFNIDIYKFGEIKPDEKYWI